MEKRLVKKVQEHELLYRVDHALYRDRVMRAASWMDISKELGITAAQCKEMWRKLRNCYLNAINRRQHKNIPKWKYETEMAFLLPFLDLSSRSQQQQQPESDVKPELSYSDGSEVAASAVYDPASSPPASPEAILPETSGLTPGGRRFFPPPLEQQRDETELFFLSISETVKRLRPVDQARIKMQLCNAVYEAEIRTLEADEQEEARDG